MMLPKYIMHLPQVLSNMICRGLPRRDDIVASLYATHALGGEFANRRGYNKDHHRNGTYCLPVAHLCSSPSSVWNCLWDMHDKDRLGSFVRVGY